MQGGGATPDRSLGSHLRNPDRIILALLALAAVTAFLRPVEVPEAEIPPAAVILAASVERPTYGFDPGPSFFAGGTVQDLPIASPQSTGYGFRQIVTYREDTGPGFFELIDEGGPETPVADMPDAGIFIRLFDTPLPMLERHVGSAGLPQDGLLRLRVEDFGAIADPAIDNRQAIQDAIDYAHAIGGGVIHLGEGVYGLSGDPRGQGSITLRSNTFLQGAGMGTTVLRLVDGWNGGLVGLVRTQHGRGSRNYGLADLTLDGNRSGTSGEVDAFNSGGGAGSVSVDEDAWILRVEARDFSGSAFDPHEGTRRLTIAGSIARDNGRDGFVAGGIKDAVFRRNIAVGNGRHGFNVLTSSNGFILEESVAQSNGSTGLVIQPGTRMAGAPHNLRIARMQLTDNGREGVLVRQSSDIDLAGIISARNGTYGVRIQGSRNVTLRDSIVMDNSTSERGAFAAVQIRDMDATGTSPAHPSRDVVVRDSVIGWQVPVEQRAAVQEVKGDVVGTVVSGNHFRGNLRRKVEIGSRDTLVRNHGLGLDRIVAAARGLLAGAAPAPDSAGCADEGLVPLACAAPDVRELWPEGLD